jgi:beta-lactamase class A
MLRLATLAATLLALIAPALTSQRAHAAASTRWDRSVGRPALAKRERTAAVRGRFHAVRTSRYWNRAAPVSVRRAIASPNIGLDQTSESLGLSERALTDLAPDSLAYLASRAGVVGIAVIVPGKRAAYTYNGDQQLPMASVVKVAIMATLMAQAGRAERDLTAAELSLLRKMITESDNQAADRLWLEVGEGEAVADYLQSIGLGDVGVDQGNAWGASIASAREGRGHALLVASATACSHHAFDGFW